MDYESDDKRSVSMASSSDMGSAVSFPRKARSGGQPEPPTSCCDSIMRSLRTCWQSRDTDDFAENKEMYIKTTLRELIIYVLFLVILVIVAFCSVSGSNYYFTSALNGLFGSSNFPNGSTTTFMTAGGVSDFWTFLRGPLLDGLYWQQQYNGVNLPESQRNFILYENKLLGLPRLRQVKVRSDSCVVAADFQEDVKECYAEYSDSAEDKAAFGDGNHPTAWNYTDGKKLGNQRVEGMLATYPAGGYYVDLNTTAEDTTTLLDYLYNNLWITRATRMATVDFTVYNPNINLFCFIRLMMEFPATGGGLPYMELRTVKLLRYVRPLDYFVLACECIFLLFVAYYIVEETIEISKHKLEYFKSLWNILDVIVLLLCLVAAGFNIYRTVAVHQKLESLLQNVNVYADFDFISYWQMQFDRVTALLIFLAWVKVFKYISFNKTMTQLTSTLDKCAGDLLGFGIMFCIIFFAFAQLGFLLFGAQVEDFRSFTSCVLTLFRIIVGDFNFSALEAANRILGPLFFIVYVFFVFFVLLNMFLAIINDTYAEVKDDIKLQSADYELGDFFKQRAQFFMEKLNIKREKIVDIQQAMDLADTNNDDKVDFEELRAQLKNRGYADGEIEAIFSRYDSDGNRALDRSEQTKMQNELDQQKATLAEEMQGSSGGGAMNPQVMGRLEEMEDMVKDMSNKLQHLYSRLDFGEPPTSSSYSRRRADQRSPMDRPSSSGLQSELEEWGVQEEYDAGSDMPSSSTSRVSMGKWKAGKRK